MFPPPVAETRRELLNKGQVDMLQDQAQLALAHYVGQTHPHNPARFGESGSHAAFIVRVSPLSNI